MKLKTWVMAGLSRVCKALREGFDSLPRLHRTGIRFPQDCSRLNLVRLVMYHHKQHVEIATKHSELKERYVKLSKELSALKRQRKS